jgi:glucose-6-phosphate isomerase
MDGKKLTYESGPIVWGEPGTNGQHAFFQLIHQGTKIVPCEFLVGAVGSESYLVGHHSILVANCLAQSEALMRGLSLSEVIEKMKQNGEKEETLEFIAAHRVFPGNRPSTTLVYSKLSPSILGKILALYEHRVFVEGIILGINSFDQWGVELGKVLAEELTEIIEGEKSKSKKDGSTQMLLSRVAAYKKL